MQKTLITALIYLLSANVHASKAVYLDLEYEILVTTESKQLERLEEKFYFPAVLVDSRDRGGAEVQVVGKKNDLALVVCVPNHDSA